MKNKYIEKHETILDNPKYEKVVKDLLCVMITGLLVGIINDNKYVKTVSYAASIVSGKVLTKMAKIRIMENINKYNDLNKLYKEFLQNYNKLNKTFGFDNPLEIYKLYSYLLYKGYLSKDKNFISKCNKSEEIDMLLGTNIISGNGVCRHISSLLNDILNYDNKESYILGVYLRSFWENVPDKFKDDKKLSLINKIIGNHVIVYVVDNNLCYFLDPGNREIYTKKYGDKKMIYKDDFEILITKGHLLYKKALIKMPNLYHSLNEEKLNIIPEEKKKILDNATYICNNNEDLFEKFYKENQELYQDIDEARKRMLIRKH